MTKYQSPMSRPVRCSECGRLLRGQPTLRLGYMVREHYRRGDRNQLAPVWCPGARRFDHQPAEDGAHRSKWWAPA